MPVPRTRLLVWFAAIVIPLAALGTLVHGTLAVALAGIFLFLAVCVFDACAGRAALSGIALELPAVVRLQKDREGALGSRVRNVTQRSRIVRFGLPFPREVPSSGEDIVMELPAGAEFSILEWQCHGLKRGRYSLDRYFLEITSRFGLWAFRASRTAACELRVYPNFLEERKHVATLFLNRGRVGIHAQRQAGKGREFEKLRDYVPGDSFEDIHWKASAKRGRPVTKVFQVERTQEVYVVLDTSRLLARDPVLFDRYVTAALLLGIAAEQQGDAFGILVFSDRILHFARARSGAAQFAACREMIHAVQPQPVTPDFDELATFIRTRLRKRALLVFLTALDDPAISESFLHAMDLIRRQHLILVNTLRPPTAQPLFSDSAVVTADDVYGRLGGHLLWHDLRELGKVLQRRGVRFSLLEPANISGLLLNQYVNIKAMQLV